ncbi:MAG: LamG domain-containing protein [Lentisphaeria bacterium]|nr:LamG domain-containing protein [Lentisphaeria bacterium]
MNTFKTLFAAVALSAFALCGAEPYLSFPLNEGDVNKVREATGKIDKVTVWNANQFEVVDGPDGKAFNFNTPDKIKTYAGLCFNMPSGFDPAKGFTFTALVKTPENMHRSRQYELFFWSNSHGKGPGFRIYVSWKALWVCVGDGKKAVRIASKNSQGTLKDNTFYRVAVSYDGETVKVYVNGTLRNSAQGVMTKSTRQWAAIGASSPRGSAYGFNGIISDVKLFDKVLTDAEIAEMKPEM